MPLYEYQCQDCDTEFEELVSSSSSEDTKKVSCQKCSSKKVKKLISATCVKKSSGAPSLMSSPSGCGPAGSGFS